MGEVGVGFVGVPFVGRGHDVVVGAGCCGKSLKRRFWGGREVGWGLMGRVGMGGGRGQELVYACLGRFERELS